MEMGSLDDDEFSEDTMCCPHCSLPLYQKDDKKRILLFICRSCAYEAELDYEISWENHKVNGISILPSVKEQGGGDCFPCAILTVVESQLKMHEASTKRKFAKKLSVDNLVHEYENVTGQKYGKESAHDSGQYNKRMRICRTILKEQGAVTTEGNGPFKAKSFWKSNATFNDIADLLRQGVLLTNIPVTCEFNNLSPDDIYIADDSKVKINEEGGEEWHAIVLIGFGSRNNEKYFRFMNSWGTKFCDRGFGRIRALEIKDVLLCKLEH
ncbi:unnamed protein product [Urochloa decumbens]|uniref:Peptidase C1A papain C-terminal domain-containing protein n=1 Tax=Urochloa decumbens TaxID=240449 RepID=A0ABC8XVU7_9POAL